VRTFWTGRDIFCEWFFRDIFSDIRKFSVLKEERLLLMPCPVVAACCWFQLMLSDKLMIVSRHFYNVRLADAAWRHHRYLLIYCMKQGPCRESDSFSANQVFPHTLRNHNFHHRIHKLTPLVPQFNHQNPVSVQHSTSCRFISMSFISISFSRLHPGLLNIISLRFSHQELICTSPLPHAC